MIVDAGVGTASDVTVAMELGADGVLLNTGIAHAKDPVKMAKAMQLALEAGRLASQSGRIPKRRYARRVRLLRRHQPYSGRIIQRDCLRIVISKFFTIDLYIAQTSAV